MKRHFPVGSGNPEHTQNTAHAPSVACVVFFVLCLGLWLACFPSIAYSVSITRRGHADGFGMGLFAWLCVTASVPILVIALVFSLLASRLPLWFRIVSLLPGLAGIVVGVWIVVDLLIQGK